MPAPFSLTSIVNGNASPDYRLSDASVYFKLYDAQTETLLSIREPVGFDASQWQLVRSTKWHGFTGEFFGDDEVELKFRQVEAVDFIERAYASYGPDAKIVLRWGLTYGTDTLPCQSLQLLLSKHILVGGELSVPCTKDGIHVDLESRWDTIISMDAKASIYTNANGASVPINPPSPAQLVLHAQRIRQTTIVPKLTESVDSDWIGYHNTGGSILQGGNPLEGLAGANVYRDFYISLPLSKEKASPDEVEIFNGSTFGQSSSTPPPALNTKAEGSYTFTFKDVDLQVDARLQKASVSISPPKITTFSFKLVLVVGSEQYNILTPIEGSRNDRFLEVKRISGNFSITLELPKGVDVFCYAHLHLNTNRDNWKGTDVRATVFSGSLEIVASTTAPQSTTGAYPIIDVLRHLGACLTGRGNAVQSGYYSLANSLQPVDGGGSHRLITSGFLLRGFLTKPLQISLQKFMESLQAIDSIGMSYKPTPDGDIMVIEPAANWYRDNEILRLNSYWVVEDSVETQLLHPSAVIGYSKYPDEGPMVLDDFNTRQEYAMPQRDGEVFTQLSDLIASGYAIEQTRRVQFSSNPNDSTSYDDDAFIICVDQTGPVLPGASAVSLPGTFTTTAKKASLVLQTGLIPSWLGVGTTFSVAGSAANNGLYKVLEIVPTTIKVPLLVGPIKIPKLLFRSALILNRAITSESGTYTLSVSGSGSFVAEKNEDFDIVTGVVDPSTVYNLRLAPRFNLMRHFPVLSGSLVYKSGSEILRNTFSKNNTGLTTRLKQSAQGDLNIAIRQGINHNNHIYVADMRTPIEPLWLPETVKIETKLTIDQMLYLRACLTGTHPDPALHYGYISLVNGDTLLKGFPMEISFTPASGKAVLTLRKKFVSLSELQGQRGCSFYGAFTFGEFESSQPGAVDNWIERCTFDNFQ